jgi:hypothetical protein
LWQVHNNLTSVNGQGISTQLLLSTKMHVDLHVKCQLLFLNFDQNWNVSKFSKTAHYPILRKSITAIIKAVHTDRHSKANVHIFPLSAATVPRNGNPPFYTSTKHISSLCLKDHIHACTSAHTHTCMQSLRALKNCVAAVFQTGISLIVQS